ncbi:MULTISPECIES: anthranilate synthase [Cyanophyceae]|uniref:Anthranilate synthase n=1 Tax=Nodularia spumigena CENA596 TaxID=1819295 RepID=A0A166JGB2_NODSP|nr:MULTISPECIES: anthranilate synthase [Cyanophyceae]MDB9356200.1 anthranilate synthase [Nodularia spumigena CS-587/03]KZL49671.1 anthranilate synthase [Nodularia spumigena CENA596]MDB9306477.1 anthranilate synthase [Nodularia spumigena CS-591/12]MDB9341732.1 anthranilate synthase [Nodularia spumigena CS-589/07]MDB9343988.1 anthranilate synthase [Nodularia spumigena CS-588/06]
MNFDSHSYRTLGGVLVSRSVTEVKMDTALEEILFYLDSQRGGLLASSYEYPGRYKRWAIGFVNPPLELTTRENAFTLTALNERGQILLPLLLERLCQSKELRDIKQTNNHISGFIEFTNQFFAEEQRSKQPSAFTVVREILHTFSSQEDEHLGLYGAFGYDLVFQFEPVPQSLERPTNQRDLVLYLPDELIVVDYYLQQAFRLQYEFETAHGITNNLPRTGESIDYRGQRLNPDKTCDHHQGEYAKQVELALDYFRRGDLFEVVPGQNFFESCEAPPSKLFNTLKQINPSPYGFIFNLGGEYIIGASPEMFVRVEGRRIETCPISGTITRGQDALDDADQIRQLLNSHKDEAELTMCTDVDRNDKSRICEPGSVQVIGRRQIELYSHLIHTVDHVEGILRPEFDALDAFLTHTWAVTVTGAPKRAAIQFIEQHERSARRWYGGAVGYLNFNGNLNTGLILRTIRLQDSIAEVRVGATVLYDSIPQAEEQETITKAAALFETIRRARQIDEKAEECSYINLSKCIPNVEPGKRILLIDHEDSFVHTLANYIRQTGASVTTLRHGFAESLLDTERPDLVVLSPGPGRPNDFRVSETVAACIERQIPIFGVCLGLQGIVEAFGGKLGVLNYPQHGKSSRIFVTDTSSVKFKDLPKSFAVGRYHSLFALQEYLPEELKVTAISDDNIIMGIEHRNLPIAAVQFHPESIMTLSGEVGLAIIKNVMLAFTEKTIVISH